MLPLPVLDPEYEKAYRDALNGKWAEWKEFLTKNPKYQCNQG